MATISRWWSSCNPAQKTLLAAFVAATATLVWAFWPTLVETAEYWAHDPQYSHGYLVPVFAAALLWMRRGLVKGDELRPSWWGLPVLLLGLGAYVAGAYFYVPWVEAVALVPSLAGLCLALGGRAAFRWAWPGIVFLVFMYPLPHRVAYAMSGTLQHIATLVSTFALQTVGLPAIAEGNVIHLNEVEIGIVEACSGLRMLVVFFALSTAVALVCRRPLWEKLLILVSAVPIALLSNMIRIVATGILHLWLGSAIADAFFHDLAGWIMMPVGLAFLWLELKILDHLFIEVQGPAPTRTRRAAPTRSVRRVAPA